MARALLAFAFAVRTRLAMPLFIKELTEAAARRRTFLLRVVYALGLFGIFALVFARKFGTANLARFTEFGIDPSSALLGYGREIFALLMQLQFCGVLLFLPAIMCGRITQEKERDSLVLLFLTDLRPWEIVLQKYFGGLVPMFSFLLLGLPLAGIAYAFGGLERDTLLENWIALMACTLQIGALSLMCSAWCRSTVGALICAYLLSAVLCFGFGMWANFTPSAVAPSPQWVLAPVPNANPSLTTWTQTAQPYIAQGAFSASLDVDNHPSSFDIVVAFVTTGTFLLLARIFIVRRASVPPSNLLPRLFSAIDGFMKRANRVTGGVVLYRDGGSLPAYEPVFWRETHRRVLGKPHYLARIFCVIEIPTVIICLWASAAVDQATDGLSQTFAVLAILVAFSLAVTAANTLVTERVGQTLEVLLTTPLSAWQIIREKERALWRLNWVLAVPLLTVIGCETYLRRDDLRSMGSHGGGAYATCAILSVVIYLPMITWLSLWIGLRMRTRFQAIVTAIGAVTLWAGLYPVLLGLFKDRNDDAPIRWLALLSPLTVPALNERGLLGLVAGHGAIGSVVFLNAYFYAALALIFRFLLFVQAERCLRR